MFPASRPPAQEVEPLPNTSLVLVTEEAVGSEDTTTVVPSRPIQTPATPGSSSSQHRTGGSVGDMISVCTDKRTVVRDSCCRVTALVGPGLAESGFSAQQLSPLEIKFRAEDAAAGGFGSYEALQTNPSAKTKPMTQTMQSTGMVPPSYGTLPLIG